MSGFLEGEIVVELGGTVGPAGPAGNAVPIAAGTVLANPTEDLANPVGTSAEDMRSLLSSVAYVSQTLTETQQRQALANIGSGLTHRPSITNTFGGGAGNSTNASGGTTGFGVACLNAAATVNDSAAFGSYALRYMTGGVGNTAVGSYALEKVVSVGNNTAVGDSALRECLTAGNGAFGYITLENLTTGEECNAFGRGALHELTTGDYCNAFGNSAGFNGTTSNRNNWFGYFAGQANVVSSDNTGMGHFAFYNLIGHASTTGENTGFGVNAGFSVTTGFRNTFLGANAGNNASQKVDAANSTAIGNGAFTTADNQVVIGNTDVTSTVLRGDVATSGTMTCRTAVGTTPSGGGQAVQISTISGFGIYWGSGAPSAAAAQGSLYLRVDGSSTTTRMYVNTNGGTTWTAVATVA
jgi:hypothetical protein